ncbi:MAG: NADH:flavin oxidoreductase [Succinivibrionaceae bacterium]|nr:NADH:flavin oxidoreductase [Succinivibrionaceae bacterium]
MKKAFDEVELNRLSLKNRLMRSATWEGIAAPNGGLPGQTYDIYRSLAKGGIGAIITGFASVSSDDFYFDGMMRLSEDSLIPEYRKLAEVIHQESCPVIVQLALGAYYRREADAYRQVEPDEMTPEEIGKVADLFGCAASRAAEAGFDGVQIHAAHFFFLSRFISPAVNHRTDSYGGSAENRARILLEILAEIRRKAPALHVTVKINCSDFIHGGLDEEESAGICQILDQAGIDSIEVSGNGTSARGIKARVNEGYFAPAAESIAEKVSCPVMVVGGFRSLDAIEAVLNSSKIELISLSRPLLCQPDLPMIWRRDPKAVSGCVSCNRCYSSPAHRCVLAQRSGR